MRGGLGGRLASGSVRSTTAAADVRLGATEFFPWPAGRCDGEEAAEGRKCEGGAGNGSGRESVHDTTCDPLVEPNRCQVGPTILFECPAQIPRSSPRSFSLWATPG